MQSPAPSLMSSKRGHDKQYNNNNEHQSTISPKSTSRSLTRGKRPSLVATNENNNNNNDSDNNITEQPPNKKQKLTTGNQIVTVTTDGHEQNNVDNNDTQCRICKHPGMLLCCEACPATYHRSCILPRPKQSWIDKFEEWYCPSCSPRYFYVPLRYKDNPKNKWPVEKEPLLIHLQSFLESHPNLEKDPSPDFHKARKKNKHKTK